MGNDTQIGQRDWLTREQLRALLNSPKWFESSFEAVALRMGGACTASALLLSSSEP